MAHPKSQPRLAPAEYLQWEAAQPDKHEFVDGEIFAMVGATRDHVTISLNAAALLKEHLRGGPYRVYMSDMKLRVERANAFFYPDVMVTCDARDHRASTHLEHPMLIVEVLSESTAAYDRGEKFAKYRQLASLKEYVVVDPATRRIDCFRRDPTDHWVLYDFKADETVTLQSIDFQTPIAAIFENVESLAAESTASQQRADA
jgi:Uma2 family endonuclease